MKIPYGPGVIRAVRKLGVAATKSLVGLNKVAGQRMAKGDYTGAEALAAKGREIAQFQRQVDELLRTWRALSAQGNKGQKRSAGDVTPLWAYYQPILRAIVDAGGECRREEIEAALEQSGSNFLQPADRVAMRGGRTRVGVMVRRARKHLRSEGWIEEGIGRTWRVTSAGRKAAESGKTGRP